MTDSKKTGESLPNTQTDWVTVAYGRHKHPSHPSHSLDKVFTRDGTFTTSHSQTHPNTFHRKPAFSVTRGGSVALYGFHKKPLVLYANRWRELRDFLNSGEMEKFMDEHEEEIRKPNPSRGWDTSTHSLTHSSTGTGTGTGTKNSYIDTLTKTTVSAREHTQKITDKHATKPYLKGDA